MLERIKCPKRLNNIAAGMLITFGTSNIVGCAGYQPEMPTAVHPEISAKIGDLRNRVEALTGEVEKTNGSDRDTKVNLEQALSLQQLKVDRARQHNHDLFDKLIEACRIAREHPKLKKRFYSKKEENPCSIVRSSPLETPIPPSK